MSLEHWQMRMDYIAARSCLMRFSVSETDLGMKRREQRHMEMKSKSVGFVACAGIFQFKSPATTTELNGYGDTRSELHILRKSRTHFNECKLMRTSTILPPQAARLAGWVLNW